MNRYASPLCPLDNRHGHLTDWPSATAAWYCSARAHEGVTPFYTSDLVPVPRSGRLFPPAGAQTPRRERRGAAQAAK